MSTFTTILAVTLVLFLSKSMKCSVIQFNTNTDSINPLTTTDFTLICLLKDTPDRRDKGRNEDQNTPTTPSGRCETDVTVENVDYVTSIVISNDGVDIASLTVSSPARPVVTSPGISVTGSLSTDPGVRGMLQVTGSKISNNQKGKYKCDIDTINSVGHSFDFSETLEISEEQVSMDDLVNHLQGLVNHVASLENIIDNMVKSEGNTNHTISALQKDNVLQKREIENLTNKKCECTMNPAVLFSASLSNSRHYTGKKGVLYDRVFTNEGAAYNPSTGVFTCPIAGFYKFDVDAATQQNKFLALHLQQNDSNKLTMVSHDGHGEQSASGSAILKLAKGDTIRVIAYISNSYLSGGSQSRNLFSGHLLAIV